MKRKYKAIHELNKKLDELGISHKMHNAFDGWQIYVPKTSMTGFEGDAVQHQFSYGNEEDLIEVWGFGLDEPVGYLTADEALKYFVEWHERKQHGK